MYLFIDVYRMHAGEPMVASHTMWFNLLVGLLPGVAFVAANEADRPALPCVDVFHHDAIVVAVNAATP